MLRLAARTRRAHSTVERTYTYIKNWYILRDAPPVLRVCTFARQRRGNGRSLKSTCVHNTVVWNYKKRSAKNYAQNFYLLKKNTLNLFGNLKSSFGSTQLSKFFKFSKSSKFFKLYCMIFKHVWTCWNLFKLDNWVLPKLDLRFPNKFNVFFFSRDGSFVHNSLRIFFL